MSDERSSGAGVMSRFAQQPHMARDCRMQGPRFTRILRIMRPTPPEGFACVEEFAAFLWDMAEDFQMRDGPALAFWLADDGEWYMHAKPYGFVLFPVELPPRKPLHEVLGEAAG
jgi:hypothetical protein